MAADPIYACELALRLHMPVGEMLERMSLHEFTVVWPAYLAYEHRQKLAQQRAEERQRRRIVQ